MNILIINSGPKSLPAVKGGGVETLIQALISHRVQNCNITIASMYSDVAEVASRNYPHVKFVYLNFSDFVYKLQLLIYYFFNHFVGVDIGNALCNLLRRNVDLNQYDVIVSENGVRLGKSLRRHFDGKLILHLHNDWLNTRTKFAKEYKQAYNQVWTISKFLKKRVDEIEGNVPVYVLYNGVDTNLFSISAKSERDIFRNKYGIGPNDIVIANCCRIVEEKGVLQTIQVFEKIKKCFGSRTLKLLIIGDVSVENPYIKKVKNAASRDVIFTGFVSHDNLPQVMGCADIGIASTIHLNSKYIGSSYDGVIECFNLTIIEFLSLGIPVIATNSGGMPEIMNLDFKDFIIEARESDFSKSLECALEKMINQLNFNNLEKESVHSASLFSIDNYINRFYALLEQL